MRKMNYCSCLGILFLLVIGMSALLPCSADASELIVGYGEVDITPAMGTGMPGYFHERKAEGVLDPLLIKAMTLTCDGKTIVIAAVDLISIKRPVIDRMRSAIQFKTGIAPRNVFVHATHTHTGAIIEEVADQLPGQISAAVQKALDNAQPENQVASGTAYEDSVTFIRRFLMKDGSVRTNPGRANPNIVHPIGDIDNEINVLSFQSSKIALVSHGLHCDCLGGSKFSADYPYHLTEGVREELGSEWKVIYLNACCGNINHINVNDKNQKSNPEGSRKIGRTLAKAAIRAYKDSKPIKIDKVDSRVTEIQCPVRKVPKELYEWAKAEMQSDEVKASKRKFNEYTPKRIIQLAETKEKSRPAEIIALRIGPVGIVGMPAECFVELSEDIQEHSLMDATWVIGLTGGSMGYQPHPRGYDEGGYEANYGSARQAPETPVMWCDAAIDMLKELKAE
jgi:hypothetical protein